jgi:hypothetical protein
MIPAKITYTEPKDSKSPAAGMTFSDLKTADAYDFNVNPQLSAKIYQIGKLIRLFKSYTFNSMVIYRFNFVLIFKCESI